MARTESIRVETDTGCRLTERTKRRSSECRSAAAVLVRARKNSVRVAIRPDHLQTRARWQFNSRGGSQQARDNSQRIRLAQAVFSKRSGLRDLSATLPLFAFTARLTMRA